MPKVDGGNLTKRRNSWARHTQDWRNGYHAGYRVRPQGPERRVRWRLEGFEMQCPTCALRAGGATYWPLTPEFWNPRNLARCRACILIDKRQQAKARYWADPETHRQIAIDYYRANQRVVTLKKRHYHATHKANDNARSKAWREQIDEAQREAIRASRRAYYAKNRERLLLREKLRRAGVVPAKAA